MNFMNLRTIPLFLAAGLVTACGSTGDIGGMKVEGGAYEQGLRDGYVRLADEEFDQTDMSSGNAYVERAKMAAMGKPTAPEELTARKLVEPHRGELAGARTRLMAAFAKDARQKVGADTANAQVMFDCWMEQAEENIQPDDIARCRGGFMAAMAKIDGALGAKVAAMPAPAPAAPHTERFVVYFDTNSATIAGKGLETIGEAVSHAKAMKASNVFVVGHADRKGPDKANMMLAEKRAAAVTEALAKGGVKKSMLGTVAEGEARPAVATRDGVGEVRNRRVEIMVVY